MGAFKEQLPTVLLLFFFFKKGHYKKKGSYLLLKVVLYADDAWTVATSYQHMEDGRAERIGLDP